MPRWAPIANGGHRTCGLQCFPTVRPSASLSAARTPRASCATSAAARLPAYAGHSGHNQTAMARPSHRAPTAKKMRGPLSTAPPAILRAGLRPGLLTARQDKLRTTGSTLSHRPPLPSTFSGVAITTTSPDGLGGYTAYGPSGITTINPDGLGGYTAYGPSGITTASPDGLGGYTIYGPPSPMVLEPND